MPDKEKGFKFPISFQFFISVIAALVTGIVPIFIVLGNTNLYKFFLITVFNLFALGAFTFVLWMIVVGIPRIISVIDEAVEMPGKVNDYVRGRV